MEPTLIDNINSRLLEIKFIPDKVYFSNDKKFVNIETLGFSNKGDEIIDALRDLNLLPYKEVMLGDTYSRIITKYIFFNLN